MKKFAVVLSGCGVFDGAEIHESVLTMLAIMRNGGSYTLFAPDKLQHHVINHLTGEEMKESRNVLVESARIARGKIFPLHQFHPEDFDILVFPGGFGAAKNLCTFAMEGENCSVEPDVESAIKGMMKINKPIGAMCISPVILARIIGDQVEVTIGNDEATAQAITKMNGLHKNTNMDEVITDYKHKVVTTACYMMDASIVDIAMGTENLIKKLLEL